MSQGSPYLQCTSVSNTRNRVQLATLLTFGDLLLISEGSDVLEGKVICSAGKSLGGGRQSCYLS